MKNIHRHIHEKVKKHIYHTRTKSNKYKQIYAFTISFVFTLCIFIIWYVFSFPKIIESYNLERKQSEIIKNDNNIFDINDNIEEAKRRSDEYNNYVRER